MEMNGKNEGKVTLKVLSVQQMEFTDKQTGQKQLMWRVYAADNTGAVGSVYSSKPVEIGATITVGLVVNREGKFAAKIMA